MKKTSILFSLITLLGLQLIKSQQQISVDFSDTRQIIRGFGGIHISAWTGRVLTDDMIEKAFDNNPGEMGLSIFRMQIGENPSSWSNELGIAKYALNKGAIIFASPWNPPAHMRIIRGTFNNETDYMLLEEYYDDYVVHLNSFISYMNNNDVPLYAISIQNEPDWHGWTTWTTQEMIKFLKENASAINCRIIAPESFNYGRSYIDPFLNDSIANARIDILGTHLYGTSKSNYYYPLAYQKNKEIWMTEHLLGSEKPEVNTWSLALEFADEINTCMDANMSAYVYWYIRRFYGLIDDAGNITDKGYVISHFSKFIRPGSFRVNTLFNPMTNVNVTAYKSDSTITLVVVNKNSIPVNLSFNLQNLNSSIDSLIQFTTSASKKIVNDGTIKLVNGKFQAILDASSIVTFTSNGIAGGKYGNLPPVAYAGDNISILDSIGTGVTVQISGSNSYDTDGNIVKYSWSKDGLQIASTAEIETKLETGEYIFVLTVTDNDGATSRDTILVNIYSNKTAEIWLEAECTDLGSHWNLIKDKNTSNGHYLMVKSSYESIEAPINDSLQYLKYNIFITQKGNYKIWGRVLAPSPNDDSFWIIMNNGDWIRWNNIQGGSAWTWDDVHNHTADNVIYFYLDSGHHTFTVAYRENGTGIDKWYITNTGKKPTAFGENTETCFQQTFISNSNTYNKLSIYPNPARHSFTVNSQNPYQYIVIYDSKGSIIFKQRHANSINMQHINLNVNNGLYWVKVVGQDYFAISKLMIIK